MNVLVTGADGMLGSNLVRLLLKRNHQIKVLLHPSSKSKTLEGLKIEKIYGDILKPESLDAALSGTEVVIHAAASTAIWPARSEKVRTINITGTQNIVNKVLEHGIKKLIYVGSGSSVNTKGSPDNKYHFPGAKFGLDYIDSKYEALNLVMDAVKNRNLNATAILPTFMLGPYDSLPGSGQLVLAIAKGKIKFYTSGGRNYIHVNDVATAIANSIGLDKKGKYFIAGNENLSYKDFLKIAADVVNRPEPKIKVPDMLLKCIGDLLGFFGTLFKIQPLISPQAARISCENQFVSSEEAVKELNMPQTPVKKAVEDCYEWFKLNGYC